MNATVTLLEMRRHQDQRGWFAETWSEARLDAMGIRERFVQDNHSFSAVAGTVRGIHLQAPPQAQAKLVRCVRGSIIDYAIDLRRGSPTFGKVAQAHLSDANGRQLFVPRGFGHAFITLENDTEVAYKVTAPYAPELELGVIWNDPDLGIAWPAPIIDPLLSARDASLPTLADFRTPFVDDGIPMTTVGDMTSAPGDGSRSDPQS